MLKLLFLTFFCGVLSAEAAFYYSPSCTHCHEVTDYLNQIHKSVPMKNVNEAYNYNELKRYGQSGVPVLVVNGKAIPGAKHIINYMKEHPEILK